jgi:hypothetical protein
MRTTLKEWSATAVEAVELAFKKAVEKTGAVLNGDEAKKLKERALEVYDQATSICRNLVDVDGNGKFDADDLKAAAEKAGIAWDKVDPDMKQALLAGGVAAVTLFLVPVVGHALAVPIFAATTAYFFLFAKLKKLNKK